jgi:hypothetical protein
MQQLARAELQNPLREHDQMLERRAWLLVRQQVALSPSHLFWLRRDVQDA